jgi:hypothetical protein
VKINKPYGWGAALLLGSAITVGACGGGTAERAEDQQSPTASTADPGAARQTITLTGCLKRGVQPGEFTLASVGTGGVLDPAAPAAADERADSAAPGNTAESAGTIRAGTSYRLVADADEDLHEYVDKRVAVRGRLAADTPVGTTGDLPEEGVVVESSPTNATVAADAPPLRGFHVESVNKVADSCAAE